MQANTSINQPLSTSQKIGLTILSIMMILLGMYILEGFLRALVWAGIFAVALHPLYSRVENKWQGGKHNILLPLSFTLAVALLFLIPLVLIGVKIGAEAATIAHMARDYRLNGVDQPSFVAHLPWIGTKTSQWWAENLSDPAAMKALLQHFDRDQAVAYSGSFGKNILHRVVMFAVTLLALFFLFRDGKILGQQMYQAAERLFGHRGGLLGQQIVQSVHGTVNGLVLVGIGEGAIMGVVYAFAGLPHAVIFGAITAVAAMLPFGAPLVFAIAAITLFAQSSTIGAIAVLVAGFVVAFVADHMIRPVLIGGATALPFIWVLLGTLGGAETFGLLGLFVGPAVMSILILLWRDWVYSSNVAYTDQAEPKE